MRTRHTLQPPQCAARTDGVRCERPTDHGGPHRVEILDSAGHPTGRLRSWYDRWAA